MQGVDGCHGSWDGGTLDVHVALQTGSQDGLVRATGEWTDRCTGGVTGVYLCRVLVHIDVDHSSMLVALLDDVVQNVLFPARGRLAAGQSHDLTRLPTACACACAYSPAGTEHVGQLKAVGGQWLRGQGHRGRGEGEGGVHRGCNADTRKTSETGSEKGQPGSGAASRPT